MDRCNELCTKDATSTCTVCEALAERDRFERLWFQKEVFLRGFHVLRQWWYPVRLEAIRHTAVVREAHKQYSETLNKTMLALLGVALFGLLTTISSPDKLLLAADSTIKVPFTDAPLSFLGFIVVAPFLLIGLVIYLHVFYGYWLDYERERQHINQRVIPPIENIPTLFAFPEAVPRMLTSFVFYWLVPLVLVMITIKAWALPALGRPLTYVVGFVTFTLVVLQIHRRPDHKRHWWTLLGYAILILIMGLMVLVTFNPHVFRRPLQLFRADLAKAWLVGIDMSRARANLANLRGANLQKANLQQALLQEADLQGGNLTQTDLQGANLWGANLQGADLTWAQLSGADLRGTQLQQAKFWGANLQGSRLQWTNLQQTELWGATLQGANLQEADLQGVNLSQTDLQGANLQWATLKGTNLQGGRLQEANLRGAYLQEADLQEADLQGANLRGADLTKTKNLTQDQVQTACGDKHTKLPAHLEGLTPPPCPE